LLTYEKHQCQYTKKKEREVIFKIRFPVKNAGISTLSLPQKNVKDFPTLKDIKPYQSFDDKDKDLFVSQIRFDHHTPYMVVGRYSDFSFTEFYSVPRAMAMHGVWAGYIGVIREKKPGRDRPGNQS
jgi:hypothetical protein